MNQDGFYLSYYLGNVMPAYEQRKFKMKTITTDIIKPLSIIAYTLPLAILLGLSTPTLAYERAEPLLGANEVPPVVSAGEGTFKAVILDHKIEFEFTFEGLMRDMSDVTQAHIHVGNPSKEGGVTVFLCTNLGNTPAGATYRACPSSPGEVVGKIVAADVQGVVGKDGFILKAGDLEALKRLIEDGATYVNVHTEAYPKGEIRGQINPRER